MPRSNATLGTREPGYSYPNSHQRRFWAAPRGSIPHQFGPAAWEAKWAPEARKTNISARTYGPRGRGGINSICYPLAQYKYLPVGRALSHMQGWAVEPGPPGPSSARKQTSKIAKKKKTQSGRDTLDKENKRELLMANGRAFLERMVRGGPLQEVPP